MPKNKNCKASGMKHDDNIVPSDNPWNKSFARIVKEKRYIRNKKYKVIVDFRKFKNVTVGDAYPMLNATKILYQLKQAIYLLYRSSIWLSLNTPTS